MEFHKLKIPSVKTETPRTITQVIRILIFCTFFQTKEDVQKITPLFGLIPEVISWTVDLEDCDKVLRVVCLEDMTASFVKLKLQGCDFLIREMSEL